MVRLKTRLFTKMAEERPRLSRVNESDEKALKTVLFIETGQEYEQSDAYSFKPFLLYKVIEEEILAKYNLVKTYAFIGLVKTHPWLSEFREPKVKVDKE